MDARWIMLKKHKYGPVGKLARPLMGKFEGQVMCAPHKY